MIHSKLTDNTQLPNKSVSSTNSEVIVIVDLGASKTKVIFQDYPEGQPQLQCMDSSVADVSLDALKECASGGHIEDNCWISLPNEGSYALGYLASYKFFGNPMLRSLKFDLALPKIAGVLWVISQRLSKKTKVLKVRLCVLLPPSEGGDSKALGEKLKQELEEYMTPTGVLRVKLVDFMALREGFGIARYRQNVLGDGFNQRNITVVMVGYRNLSILPIVRGIPQKGASSDLGMFFMVHNFVTDCGAGLGADDPKVVSVLVEAGASCDATVLSKLSRKRKSQDHTADGERFSFVARTSRRNYANAVIRWLSQNIPSDTDEIIFCGGTARYIKDELTQYCNETGIDVIWDGRIIVPKVLDTYGMSERLADVFGLYQYYVSKLDEMKKKDGAARLAEMIELAQKEAAEKARKAKIIEQAFELLEKERISGFLKNDVLEEIKELIQANPWIVTESPELAYEVNYLHSPSGE
ncbi:MAG: ParM/StbA family protein [Scytonema sp. PMC 1069.18]|nr:ParM/StbA family protein [Scytonema sp. PMC 1069.18]MEC4881767.1 ParM/StbA family protein [Scytonema sp. PMC 1070.18]